MDEHTKLLDKIRRSCQKCQEPFLDRPGYDASSPQTAQAGT